MKVEYLGRFHEGLLSSTMVLTEVCAESNMRVLHRRHYVEDLVWLIPDARWGGGGGGGGGAVAGVDAWLQEYHHPSAAAVAAGSFGRVGAIQQAYVLELPHGEASCCPLTSICNLYCTVTVSPS